MNPKMKKNMVEQNIQFFKAGFIGRSWSVNFQMFIGRSSSAHKHLTTKCYWQIPYTIMLWSNYFTTHRGLCDFFVNHYYVHFQYYFCKSSTLAIKNVVKYIFRVGTTILKSKKNNCKSLTSLEYIGIWSLEKTDSKSYH